jgi:hypothetical protein
MAGNLWDMPYKKHKDSCPFLSELLFPLGYYVAIIVLMSTPVLLYFVNLSITKDKFEIIKVHPHYSRCRDPG